MADTRIRTRGVFFHSVEGTYKENGTKIEVSARERIFREPLFEIKIEGAKITGNADEIGKAIGAKLNPKIVAIESVGRFLGEVAAEVGSYATIRIPLLQMPEEKIEPKIPTPPKVHLTLEQITREIRDNSSSYAVRTVRAGYRSQAWGREVVSTGGFSIVEGTFNPKFPFEKGTINDNNQFLDQDPLSKHNSEGKNEAVVVKVTQGGVKQTKIYLYAGSYADQYGRNSTAIYVFNATAEIVESMHNMGIEGRKEDLRQIVDQLLIIAGEKFPATYVGTNSESSRGKIKLYIYS